MRAFLSMQWRMWLVLVFFTHSAFGQWLNFPTPGTARTRDGKPDLSARVPRTPDGKPDLSGVWRTERRPPNEFSSVFDVPGDSPSTFSKYFRDILADFKNREDIVRPGLNRPPKRVGNGLNICLPLSIPTANVFSYAPFKFIMGNREIVMIYEIDNTHRQIYMDGRKFPKDLNPTWLGYSVGRWEGDTLVVETTGFNDQIALAGYARSESLRIEERWHRRDFSHLDLEMTIDDPVLFLKPFTVKVTQLLEPDSDVAEMFCNEHNVTGYPQAPFGQGQPGQAAAP